MNKVKYFLIILIAVLFIAGIFQINKTALNGGGKVIYEPAAGQRYNFMESEGNLVLAGHEGITVLDEKGREQQSIIKSYANPVLSERGGYKLFYDKNGTSIMYCKNNGQPEEITTELPIINAKINSVGYMAVATMETGYKGKLEVYNHKGEVTYKWQIGNSYVVDMDVSSDGHRLVVALLSMTGETVGCRIVMINLDKAEIISDNTLENTVPFSVMFTKSNIAVIVCDTGVSAIDRSGRDKWSYKFDDKVLNSYKICENGSGAFEFYGASNNCVIEMYNSSGKKSGEYVSQNAIVALDASETAVAVTDGRFIKVLSWSGGDKGVIKSQNELRDIVILNNDVIAAIGNNVIETVKY